jgi:hypothetical protein
MLKRRHVGLDKPFTDEELERFFGMAKKGTAPGISGVPLELWSTATQELKTMLLDLLNQCLEEGRVPNIWMLRVIRPLAKSDDAVGLQGIRPITLLEVAQKILTGMLTARLSTV